MNDTKVNSVQEACAKCFAVHILKFEILQKNDTKNIIKYISSFAAVKTANFYCSER